MSREARTSEAVAKLADRQRRKAEATAQLQKIAVEFPELMDELMAMIDAPSSTRREPVESKVVVTRAGTAKAEAHGTAYARVTKLFVDNGNDWMDTGAITRESGVTRNVAANVLWSQHRNDFEKKAHPTHRRMKQWKLTGEAFDRLKKQQRLFETEGEGND